MFFIFKESIHIIYAMCYNMGKLSFIEVNENLK